MRNLRFRNWLKLAVCLPSFVGLSLIASATATAQSQPSNQVMQTDDLAEPVEKAHELRAESDTRNILLVFDIDNTLLTMPTRLGSDAWFNHNATEIEQGNSSDFRSFEALVEAQNLLFAASRMRPTQNNTAALLQSVRDAEMDVYLMSARGPELFNATVRETERHGIDPSPIRACALFICNQGVQYDGSDVSRALLAIGYTPRHAPYRPISIRDGVMLLAGQHKGEMLALLLAGVDMDDYAAVIFVDDNAENVRKVAETMYPLPVFVYHYTRWNGPLTTAEIAQTGQEYRTLQNVICSALVATICSTDPQ